VTHLKTIEAVAHRRPVASTCIDARAQPLEAAVHVDQADAAQD
jgi:hypothetical protein